MAAEMPLITAAVGHLPEEKTQLAALALVYSISLLVEAPVIMLLAASTALVRDAASYRTLARFTHGAGFGLTLLHALLAFTPLFDVVAADLVAAPPATLEPARLGLQIMTPWTWAIAARRFQQGILIRHGHSRAIVAGTAVRLIAGATALLVGLQFGGAQGIAVGCAAMAVGVVAEVSFTTWLTRPVVARHLRTAAEPGESLTLRGFLTFYVPLACTPLMTLALQPIGAAAMARMPQAETSLAAWTVVYGLIFVTRSAGFAFNEVVVATAQRPGSGAVLRRFAGLLALAAMTVLAAVSFTPAAGLYFRHWSDLDAEVYPVAVSAVGLGLLMPGYAVLQSLYQGYLVAHRRTRFVSEAVILYFILAATLLGVGVWLDRWPGVHTAIASFTLAGLAQTTWLAWRSRALRRIDGPLPRPQIPNTP